MAELSVIASPGTALIEHWLAGGEMVPAQLATPSVWTPEKTLAAAVLRDALLLVRDACGARARRPDVQQDLRWIFSEDTSWPFAFVNLCQLFGIDPPWVRGIVRHWVRLPCVARPHHTRRFRHAA